MRVVYSIFIFILVSMSKLRNPVKVAEVEDWTLAW